MFDVKEIGSRMKRRREALDLTLDDVAGAVGVAKTTILRYENGEISRPKIPVLQSIANALDVRPEWLLAQSEQMEDEDKWDWDGQYLKKLRTNCNASPEDIAFRLGIPVTRYLSIENSSIRPTVPVLVSIAEIFCTSVDLLLGLTRLPEDAPAPAAGFTKRDTEMIGRYHRASDEAKRIVDLALAPYEEPAFPGKSAESAG